MATGERLDVDLERPEPSARGCDLSGLEWVLFTARDVKVDVALELANDRREIPACRVAAMLLDESGGAMHKCCASTAADCVAEIGDLVGAHLV